MSCQHIGKKTYHQGKRLRKDSEELDKRHHGHRHFQPPGHIGPENIFPICLGSENINGKECANGQHHCNCNVTGDICPARKHRNQSHKVVYEDKEERSKQVRGKLTVLRSYTALYDIIIHHHNEHLHKPDETARSRTVLRMPAIPAGNAQYDDYQ